jgi:hypothetical protein
MCEPGGALASETLLMTSLPSLTRKVVAGKRKLYHSGTSHLRVNPDPAL